MPPAARQLEACRARARAWLEHHPRSARLLERLGCLQVDQRVIARGVAIGLFVAFTPTFGLQTLLLVVLSVAWRGNVIAAFSVSWISNPLTLAPLYLTYHQLGEAVIGPLLPAAAPALASGTYLVLGSLLLALPAAAVGYLLANRLAGALAHDPAA